MATSKLDELRALIDEANKLAARIDTLEEQIMAMTIPLTIEISPKTLLAALRRLRGSESAYSDEADHLLNALEDAAKKVLPEPIAKKFDV